MSEADERTLGCLDAYPNGVNLFVPVYPNDHGAEIPGQMIKVRLTRELVDFIAQKQALISREGIVLASLLSYPQTETFRLDGEDDDWYLVVDDEGFHWEPCERSIRAVSRTIFWDFLEGMFAGDDVQSLAEVYGPGVDEKTLAPAGFRVGDNFIAAPGHTNEGRGLIDHMREVFPDFDAECSAELMRANMAKHETSMESTPKAATAKQRARPAI